MKTVTLNKHGKFIGNELKYVTEFLDSENPNNKSNPWVLRFETAFAKRFQMKYAIAQNSGTSTLHSCLAASGVGAGDEVICPAYTVIMNAFSILYQNAIPVFADINPQTFNIDPKDVERRITDRTKAIIAVHMHGLPADMDQIMEIAKKHNLHVIEDSAQCVLGKYKGKLAGTIGHMSSFSFETKKHLSIGEGGMVLTNDEKLGTKIRKTAGIGYKTLSAGQAMRAVLPTDFQNPHYKRHDTLGWNYRMPEICACVGLAQLERIDELVERRQYIGELFNKAVEGCDFMTPQKSPEGVTNTYWTYAVKYDGEKDVGVSWREFWDLYKKNGGDGFYGALSLQYQEPVMKNKEWYGTYLPDIDLYKNKFDYPDGLCPVAEEIQPKIMQFKTNYRNLDIARKKTDILKETIKQIS